MTSKLLKSRDPEIFIPENPASLIIAFTGNGGALGGCALSGFRAKLNKRAPDAGTIGLYDRRRQLYVKGIDGLGDLASARARLEAFRAAHPGATLRTIGYSSGGFAALQYGVWLKAASITVLNGWTTFSDAALAEDKRGERRHHMVREHFPAEASRDTRLLLQESGFDGDVTLFYSRYSEGDTYQARNLFGLGCVSAYGIDSDRHGVGLKVIAARFKQHFWQSLGVVGCTPGAVRPRNSASQGRGVRDRLKIAV